MIPTSTPMPSINIDPIAIQQANENLRIAIGIGLDDIAIITAIVILVFLAMLFLVKKFKEG
jgi:hypothetical protein